MTLLYFHSACVFPPPPQFVIAPDTKVWQSLLWTFWRLWAVATKGLGLFHTIQMQDQPAKCGWANVQEIPCLRMMVTFQKEARTSLLADSHRISALRVWKTSPVWQLFQAVWSQLLQVTSLAAVTTIRTEVNSLVLFWPQHSLRSNLRAPNFPGGACPPTPLACGAWVLSHALINRWLYQTDSCLQLWCVWNTAN